jgi:2-polyprenyl-3-methyl-5-hydroxy-6-metoxy-1,4-benzoquinol methylase
MNKQQHWEQVYQTKPADTVSWFQAHAERSLALIKAVAASPDAAIIDVGGGASTLIDDLLTEGYSALTVLDLSAQALSVAKQRLGQVGQSVRWLVGDICSAALPAKGYDTWHDRAVFHFLTQPEDRQAYVNQVMKAVKPGGHVIVATFAPDGPEKCSGLPVQRYSPQGLHGEFGPAFELVEHVSEAHQTPMGNIQHFIYCHCLKPH